MVSVFRCPEKRERSLIGRLGVCERTVKFSGKTGEKTAEESGELRSLEEDRRVMRESEESFKAVVLPACLRPVPVSSACCFVFPIVCSPHRHLLIQLVHGFFDVPTT